MHDHARGGCDGDHPVARRTVLAAGGTVAAAALAGCGLFDSEGPAPVAITSSAQCDVCEMVISKHPGPNGQIFYADESPRGHDNPAWFDSLKKCFFPYKIEHERRGWSIAAMYVTDYSSVDYEVTTSGGTTYVSSHTAPESFAPARDLHYVVESDAQGAMGPDFFPFSVQDDAGAFAGEYGGRIVQFGDIGSDLVGG